MFDPQQMTVLAYGNGFTLWRYASKDPRCAIEGPGYFDANSQVRVGDWVFVSAPLVGPSGAGIFVITENEAGAVVAADLMGRG